jgi:hypothetical protein
MIQTITQLASTLDSASYIDTFVWFFLLMPLLVAVPLVIYAVLLSAVTFIRSLL